MSLDTDAGTRDDGGRDVLRAIRAADSLADLARRLDAPSERVAYVRAKRQWVDRPARQRGQTDGLPGDHVAVGDVDVFVHGITHANTDAEAAAVRGHVDRRLDDATAVYCEQGIRSMYLEDVADACAMDDYRWAMDQCDRPRIGAHGDQLPTSEVEQFVDDVTSVADDVREATFSIVEAGSAIYGEDLTIALGDAVSSVLSSPEALATGEDFEAFRKTRRAAQDPTHLADLQDYYRRLLLPQPLERDWLRRHDRQLECLTHARNARMADYVVHEAEAPAVEVIVGAAHQPGVTYYLERHRDGDRHLDGFEYVD